MVQTKFFMRSSITAFCLLTMISSYASERKIVSIDDGKWLEEFNRKQENFKNFVQNQKKEFSIFELPQSSIGCVQQLSPHGFLAYMSSFLDKNNPNDPIYDLAPGFMDAYNRSKNELLKK
jgi:hypothetical protein